MAADPKYSFKDAMRGLLVLETKAEITADLELSNIPNVLKGALRQPVRST